MLKGCFMPAVLHSWKFVQSNKPDEEAAQISKFFSKPFANDTSCLDDISVSHEEGMAILKHPKPERSDSFLMAIKDWSVKPNRFNKMAR